MGKIPDPHERRAEPGHPAYGSERRQLSWARGTTPISGELGSPSRPRPALGSAARFCPPLRSPPRCFRGPSSNAGGEGGRPSLSEGSESRSARPPSRCWARLSAARRNRRPQERAAEARRGEGRAGGVDLRPGAPARTPIRRPSSLLSLGFKNDPDLRAPRGAHGRSRHRALGPAGAP